jgi:DNA-binding NarL/FixJ family response regulator
MKGRILLVEDERDAREALAGALTRAGFEVVGAASTDEAIDALARGPYDAAVVDIVLGTDDRAGVKLVPRLRDALERGPVVVITAFADIENVKAVLNEGAAYLLEKPFRAQALLDVLARVLGDRDDLGRFVARALARAGLTEKEITIARLILKGLPSAEIARLENNSEKTIRQHVTQIYAKCGVSSRAELFHHVFPT